ncbi:MAG: MBL fold metallo-hydrolase, partial [Bacteroidota bacterium]
PDFKQQHHQLLYGSEHPTFSLAGIFLTHAHIGHYTGLMHLGREAMGAKEVPVYAMPRMKTYLETNGPWSQLVDLKNIRLQALKTDSSFQLTPQLRVDALLVPHRDEFSETVGFLIQSPNKKALFIPDIDKWHLWDRDILQLIRAVDYAFLDGTFFENGEIPGRDMSEIPHPFVEESMQLFDVLAAKDRAKVHFIHFNHTNPILQFNSEAQRMVQQRGYNIAKEGMLFSMD